MDSTTDSIAPPKTTESVTETKDAIFSGSDGSPPETVVEPESTEPFTIHWREQIIIISLMLISCFTCMEATSIGIALPIIVQDLGGTSVQGIWAGGAYLLAGTVSQPLFTSYSHIFGRKGPTVIAQLFFLIGTIISSVSPNFNVLLAGRTIQGFGSGASIALVEVLITDIVPLRSRAKYFGLVSLAWALGTAVGPLMGGGFAQNVTWKWMFWILIPFNVITMIVIPLFLRLKNKEGLMLDKLYTIDWVGTLFFVGGATSFLLALAWGGIMFPWSSFHTLVPLFLGLFGLVLFVLWEVHGTKYPLMPLRIFTSRNGALGLLQVTILGMLLWTYVYYLPIYYEAVQGYSPLITGVAVFPEGLFVAPVAAFVGFAIEKSGKYKIYIWTGWLITILGTGLLMKLDENTTIPQWIFLNMVSGLGCGLVLASTQIAVQAAAIDEDMAFVASLVALFRVLGQTIGVVVSGIVFQNVFLDELKNSSLADRAHELSLDSFQAVQLVRTLDKNSEEYHQLIHAFVRGIFFIWVTMLPLVVVALVAGIYTQSLSLDRILFTEQGVDYENENAKKKKQKKGEAEAPKEVASDTA